MATKEPKTAALKKDAPAKATTAVAVRKNMNVVDIQAQLKAQAEAMAGRTAPPTGSAIRATQDKNFKMPDGTTCTEFDAVIVDFRAVHNFYDGAYNPNDIKPPVCFAIGINPKEMVPSDKSPEKQNDACGTCPNYQWGSEGKGKACKEGRKLALLPTNDAGDDVDAEADLWTMVVSPTAVKGFDSFVQNLARMYTMPPAGFIVTVGFNEAVTYAQMTFSNPRPVDNVGAVLGRQDEAKDMLEVEPDVSGYEPRTAKTPVRKAAVGRR